MIRGARADDARAIADVQNRAWWRAYQDVLGGEVLAAMDADERARRWADAIAAGDVAVWDQDGAIAGFTSTGPARDEDRPSGTGELVALYVDPPAQGAGVGAALHERALTALRGAGFGDAILWVFAANEHARGFYERRGWADDGSRGEAMGAATVRLARGL